MCKFQSRWLCILAAALLCASCSARDGAESESSLTAVPTSIAPAGAISGDVEAAAFPPGGLPSPDALRAASSSSIAPGASAIAAAGSMNDGESMYLALGEASASLPAPQEGEEPPLMSPPLQGMAFAVYKLSSAGEVPSTLRISTGPNYKTKMWVGFANWQNNRWDFEPGGFYSTPELALNDYGGGSADYVSTDGEVAVAIVVCDEIEPVHIRQLSLNLLPDVSGFSASTNRWDGIRLRWDSHQTADSFRLWRRSADSRGEWTELSEKPLDKSVREFIDNEINDGGEYEYLIRASDVRYAQSVPQTFWSHGVSAVGSLRDSTIEEEAASIGALIPVNMQNYLSYICLSGSGGGSISALRCDSFPPQDDWQSYSSSDGIADAQIEQTDGFATPLCVYPYTATNNPAVTLGYSCGEGSFAQVSTSESDGTVAWEDPVLVRPAGHVLLSMLHLPRRIGMLSWNTAEERMELLDSIDMLGRYWYEFDPEGYPWMVVSSRRPQGVVEVMDRSSGVTLYYREALTDQLVILQLNGSDWEDQSPGVVIGSGLRVHNVLEHPAGPARCLIYVAPDGSAINMLLRNSQGEWQTNDVRELVSGTDGKLSEFELFTRGSYSSLNYIAFIEEGNLSVIRCNDPYFDKWSEPIRLSSSGTCRNVRGLTVGTDESFTQSYDYLSFIEDGPDGSPQIRYIDLSTTYNELDN